MSGLTTTDVTVDICAGLWQLVSSYVGLSQGWGLLGAIGFVTFCSFYIVDGDKSEFIRNLTVSYSRIVWVLSATLTTGQLASVSGLSTLWAGVITTVPFSTMAVWQGRFWLLSSISGGLLDMALSFASGMNWTVTLLGFLTGDYMEVVSEYDGRELNEATTKHDGY